MSSYRKRLYKELHWFNKIRHWILWLPMWIFGIVSLLWSVLACIMCLLVGGRKVFACYNTGKFVYKKDPEAKCGCRCEGKDEQRTT